MKYAGLVMTGGLTLAMHAGAGASPGRSAPIVSDRDLICRTAQTCNEGEPRNSEAAQGVPEAKLICAEAGNEDAQKACERAFRILSTSAPDARPDQPPPRKGPRSTVTQRRNSADMFIQFANDSADLDPPGRRFLNSIAKLMSKPALLRVSFAVEGHTNAVGARAYNVDLSERRAQAVRGYLVAQGVSAERLRAEGHGFDRLRFRGNPADDRNRRVEIVPIAN